VRQFEGRGLAGLERFPAQHEPAVYDLRAILGRVEELASELDADWLILHDADERRCAPWPDVGVRDALYHYFEFSAHPGTFTSGGPGRISDTASH
jgi:hypothetical protein